MKTENTTVYLRDYQPHPYRIVETAMVLDLDPGKTRVHTSHKIERDVEFDTPLVLDCEQVRLESLTLDGRVLDQTEFNIQGNQLLIDDVPEKCMLEIVNTVDPSANTQLSGLYQSGEMLCTQCEAEGFRRITPSIDRPDNLATYRVILRGSNTQYPVLLCNGNLVRDEVKNGVHETEWHDPYPKPTYLFAIVGGNLSRMEDRLTTSGGRGVKLHFYAVDADIEKCEFAVGALKRSMRWDEETYGREYDLDLYNVVAVSDFNMGAMENKSLNIFNTRYVLAQPDIATDSDFHNVESVIAHEYFHNWSGNRVTCRDWFQLSLKEGFTVFRDQCFSADMASPGVQRIDDVNVLRNHQFPEDAGPLAHPVRPDSYQEINNFYTATVYNKGAEVVRMLHELVGAAHFRQGCDLYFSRHDGQAVTTDDFVAAIADVGNNESGFDFHQFKRWYSQAGTPEVSAKGTFDKESGSYTLSLRQTCLPTAGQVDKEPFVIPVAMSLLDSSGSHLDLGDGETERVLVLDQAEQLFRFDNLESRPVPSLFRRFSAPVKLTTDLDESELGLIFRHDDDPFNRWEAGQRMYQEWILDNAGRLQQDKPPRHISTITDLAGSLIAEPGEDLILTAKLLTLPGESWLGELSKPIDPASLAAARLATQQHIAAQFYPQLLHCYERLQHANDGTPGKAQRGIRAMRDVCLGYLTSLDTREPRELASIQVENGFNLTDRISALSTIADSQRPDRQDLLDSFYERWRHEALVVDRWFRIQATARQHDVLQQVQKLTTHPAFDQSNPNKVYSLILAFAKGNPAGFHRPDGAGYDFVAHWINRLDAVNPQVAARLATSLTAWRDYLPFLGEHMQRALQTISDARELSPDVAELVSRSLKTD